MIFLYNCENWFQNSSHEYHFLSKYHVFDAYVELVMNAEKLKFRADIHNSA